MRRRSIRRAANEANYAHYSTLLRDTRRVRCQRSRYRYHRSRGFACIGYHWVVRLDGRIESGRSESLVGAHCRGLNRCSIGVCYVGGVDAAGHPKDTRTPAQRKALLHLLSELRRRYPKARIYGHRDFAPKACPCFDATKEYAGL